MTEHGKFPGGLLILSVFLLISIAMPYVADVTTVHGDSMMPTLEDGDRLLIDRLSYRVGKPKRFDVVIFSYPYKSNTYYIKRVIALPGETVRIGENGAIYVNGSILIEHYGNAPIQDGGLAVNEITLGESEYFVLGDNRNSSLDSREPDVGNIRENDIAGKGWFCILPFGRLGALE